MRGVGPDTRVVAINRFYWPDHSATSQLLTDLGSHLAQSGRPVTVIASCRRYDTWEEGASVPLRAREESGGVDIRRVWTSNLGRGSMLGRIIDYVTFYPGAAIALMGVVRRGDLVLAKTDPPMISVVAWAIARLKGARLVVWNQDLFPECAAVLGVSVAGGRLGRALGWLRDRALRGAALNVAINNSMAERILIAGAERDRVRVIPNWSDAAIRPVPHDENPLRKAWGLGAEFVIAYSGNLGRPHLAEGVAELVRRTRDLPGVSWLFIGGGSGLRHIERVIAETGAMNIHIRPYQPRAELSRSLSLADLHLISLGPDCEGLIMPSKLYGILAAGRPAMFLGDPNGAVADELAAHGIGVSLDSARPETWRDAIAELKAAPERLGQMGARARMLSEERYHATHALGAWRAALALAEGEPVDERSRPPAAVSSEAEIGIVAHGRDTGKSDRSAEPRMARLAGLLATWIPGTALVRGAFLALAGAAALIATYPGFNFGNLQGLKDAIEPLPHMAAFAVISALGALAWGLSVPLMVGLSGLAVFLEAAQFMSPGREPEVAQMAGSLAGVALGLLLARGLATEAAGQLSVRLRAFARPAFWGLAGVITVLALYPRLALPEPELAGGVIVTPFHNHVFAFLTLTVVGAVGWGLRLGLISGLALYAVAIELAQGLSPGREMALDDLLASLGGLAAGCMLVLLLRGGNRWRHGQRRSAGAR